MKKIFITALATAIGFSTLAANSATLELKGIVAPVMDISVAADPKATNLNIETGETNTKIATVSEFTNSGAFKIEARSINAGSLKKGELTANTYTIDYGDSTDIALTATDQTVKVSTGSGVRTETSDVIINMTAVDPATLEAGTYADTITFTISAN